MMAKFSSFLAKNKKIITFTLFMSVTLGAALVFAAKAAEVSGLYWTSLDSDVNSSTSLNNRGFFMVDVSDLLSTSGVGTETSEAENDIVPIGIGPLPSVPTLTNEELKLYGVLSKGDGLLSSSDVSSLDDDIHWQEIVLDENDTLASIAEEFGISAADIRKANAMAPNTKLNYSEVLYIPDSHSDVDKTLAFVKKLQQSEFEEKRQAKTVHVTAYVVQNGDTLWSIANRFNLDLDTIIGSNKLSNVNMLKLGITLRIPNQDGIFVSANKSDTVSKLADKYGSTKESVIIANSLGKNPVLKVGQEIFLPGAKVVAVIESGSRRSRMRVTTNKFTESSSRRFRWPVIGKISSTFGWRRSPFGKRRVFHSGLDIRAPRGRGISAAGSGVVVHSGWMGGYGKTIVIAHSGGISTLYGHCSSLIARRGERVNTGEIIARVGSTGRSTGNHLHFEVRRGGTPIHPLKVLR